MSYQFGAHPIYYGLIGLNVTTLFLTVVVLVIAFAVMLNRKKTRLFELSLLLFIVSFLFVTLHGRLLQYAFPISLPEKPLIDNNLTINYFLTNTLTYALFPILAIAIIEKKISAQEIGLKINYAKGTIKYTILGVFLVSSIYLLTNSFFHQQWISAYTFDGLIAWVILVTITSTFLQTLFYNGILFSRYLGKENALILGLIALFAFQSYVAPNPLPWIICNMLTVSCELFVTWKTRSIYGAVSMAITVGIIELVLQIL
jgi:hypothetical protein